MVSQDDFNTDTTFIRVHSILTDQLGLEIVLSQALLGKDLQDDLGLDSLTMVTLQVSVEDEFDLRFDPILMDLASVFQTVGTLVDFVRANSARVS